MKLVNIYTDGGCSGNQNDENTGGWGAILEYGDRQKEIYGGQINTTNNRMELLALINAFTCLNQDSLQIRVFSDSSYLVNCFKQNWYEAWLKNGWRTSAKKDVENRDLWETLLEFVNKHNVDFYHVKGHVDLNKSHLSIGKLHEKFLKNNCCSFSQEEFVHIIEMNNLADSLANKGIDENRKS